MTVYEAVKSSKVGSSPLCAIFGVCGLGHLAVQYAKIHGATVVAVDLDVEKLEIATELGADYVVNAAEQDPTAEIQKLAAPTPRSPSPCLPGPSSRLSTHSPAVER